MSELQKPARVYTQSRCIPAAIDRWVRWRDGGRCIVCGSQERLERDHDPAWNLQDPEEHYHDPDEIFLKCKVCHDKKSGPDTTRAGKWKRVGKKHRGEIKPKGTLQGGGFQKGGPKQKIQSPGFPKRRRDDGR